MRSYVNTYNINMYLHINIRILFKIPETNIDNNINTNHDINTNLEK